MPSVKEKRLIDAIEQEKPYIPVSDYEVGYNNGLTMAQSIAIKLGVVEVVRCKDCKHWDPKHCSDGQGWCSKVVGYRRGDWFCAAGKKKNDDA